MTRSRTKTVNDLAAAAAIIEVTICGPSIPDRDEDENGLVVPTFAAAAAAAVEVTIGDSTHSFGKEDASNMATRRNPLKYDNGDIDDRGSCFFVPVAIYSYA